VVRESARRRRVYFRGGVSTTFQRIPSGTTAVRGDHRGRAYGPRYECISWTDDASAQFIARDQA
jgi:hypothetical protein